MVYTIGQKFGTNYPPDAAIWCNENGAVLVIGYDGFEIRPLPDPTPTDAPPIVITSDNITIADAELLMAASTAGDKTAEWLIAKLDL